MNVLLIDDDTELTDGLGRYLALHRIQSKAAASVTLAEQLLTDHTFDVVLLDVMLPDQSGFEFLPKLKHLINAPVFMLSALGEEDDRVRGLNLGADDYVTKPFSAKELVARLRAAQRRRDGVKERDQPVIHDDLKIFPHQLQVLVAEEEVALTGAECQILILLLNAPERSVSRATLSMRVLGREASPMDRSLDVHISNLRRKLGAHPTKGNRIRPLRGRGYVLS